MEAAKGLGAGVAMDRATAEEAAAGSVGTASVMDSRVATEMAAGAVVMVAVAAGAGAGAAVMVAVVVAVVVAVAGVGEAVGVSEAMEVAGLPYRAETGSGTRKQTFCSNWWRNASDTERRRLQGGRSLHHRVASRNRTPSTPRASCDERAGSRRFRRTSSLRCEG